MEEKKVIGVLRGTFKLLHRGHVELIQKCADLVDELHIAIDSDERLIELGRPIYMNQYDRAYILSKISGVKKVHIFTKEEAFVKIFTDFRFFCKNEQIFYFKGGDYKPSKENLPELEFLQSELSRFNLSVVPVSIGLTEGYSTTELVEVINQDAEIRSRTQSIRNQCSLEKKGDNES